MKIANIIAKEMVSIDEISNYLDVEVSTVYAWVHTRQIPYYKIGRLVKFKLKEIEQWVDEKRVGIREFN